MEGSLFHLIRGARDLDHHAESPDRAPENAIVSVKETEEEETGTEKEIDTGLHHGQEGKEAETETEIDPGTETGIDLALGIEAETGEDPK